MRTEASPIRSIVISGIASRPWWILSRTWLTHVSVDAGKQAERLRIELVSGNYFAALGVQAERGRLLTPDDDRVAGGHSVAVMSYGYWQRSYGAADSALGSTVRINGFPFTIVGITAPDFQGFTVGAPAALQVPIAMQGQVSPDWQVLERPSTSWHRMLGRLQPAVTIPGAQSAMNVIFSRSRTSGCRRWVRCRPASRTRSWPSV